MTKKSSYNIILFVDCLSYRFLEFSRIDLSQSCQRDTREEKDDGDAHRFYEKNYTKSVNCHFYRGKMVTYTILIKTRLNKIAV